MTSTARRVAKKEPARTVCRLALGEALANVGQYEVERRPTNIR